MNRCTVCGATSREGAKFCTSCGARLGEENETSTASEGARTDSDTSATSSDTAAEPIVTTPETTQEPEPGHASTSTSSTAGNDHYSSSWPGAESSQDDDNEKEVEEPATETPDSATASAAQEPQTPGDSIAETSWPEPSGETTTDDDGDDESDAVEAIATPAPATETSGTGDADDEDHHGASDWESWAPTPSAPAPKSSGGSFDEHFVKLHALLDEMRLRLERTTNPATLAARSVDPDELADQLERWSRAVPDSDDLLETVKQARRSPKDIDALRQLADHAADLELLVRHYLSITETSDQWATDLRRGREEPTTES